MKFFLSLALFAAAGVSAQTAAAPSSTSGCQAQNIVTNCLEGQQHKVNACNPIDYTCLCAAYQVLQTCWNNCPKDPSAAPAQNQADAYCRNASLYATTSTPTATSSATGSSPAQTSASASNSENGSEKTGSATKATTAAKSTSTTATTDDKTGDAAGLVGNAGGVFLAVAGAVAAML